MTSIPSGSLYESILNSFFDPTYIAKTVKFGTQGDALWQQFLAQNGLSSSDPRVVSQDPTILAEFVVFAQQTSSSLGQGQLSPEEVSSRALMFSVYDLIVLMLSVLSKNVGVTGDNIAFLGHYRDAYSKMLGRLSDAFYIGGSLSIPVVNTTDLSKWTLGYGGITMQDYLSVALTGEPTPSGNGATGSPTPAYNPLTLSSANIPYPPSPAGPLSINQGMIADPLARLQQDIPIALGPAFNTSYNNVANAAMDTLTITSNGTSTSSPTQVTFTYNYKQQYDFNVTTYVYDRNDQGQITGFHQQQQVHQTGFYTASPPVTYTVNINPNLSPVEQLDQLKAGFQTFLQQPIQNQSYTPPGYTPPGPFDFYNISPKMPFPPSLNVYTSMTSPITFYNLTQLNTGFNAFTPGNVTAVRSITIPWNSTSTFNPLDQNDSQGNTSFNIPYTSSTAGGGRANAIQSAMAQNRANKNSLLQQFVTNASTQKQIISNQSDSATSQQSQSQTGISQAASVLNSMIDQLGTILTSIFQIKK